MTVNMRAGSKWHPRSRQHSCQGQMLTLTALLTLSGGKSIQSSGLSCRSFICDMVSRESLFLEGRLKTQEKSWKPQVVKKKKSPQAALASDQCLPGWWWHRR